LKNVSRIRRNCPSRALKIRRSRRMCRLLSLHVLVLLIFPMDFSSPLIGPGRYQSVLELSLTCRRFRNCEGEPPFLEGENNICWPPRYLTERVDPPHNCSQVISLLSAALTSYPLCVGEFAPVILPCFGASCGLISFYRIGDASTASPRGLGTLVHRSRTLAFEGCLY